MKNKLKVLAEYEIFGSKLRGEKDIEEKVISVVEEKKTVENLDKLAKALSVEWKCADDNVSHLKMSFSKFEEKLEKKRGELRAQAIEKENKRVLRNRNSILQK